MYIGICDDDAKIIETYTKVLQDICREENIEAQFTAYKSGDQVLFYEDEIVRDTDILFLDVKMPGTDGLETARRLREDGYEGELIFLTNSKEAVFRAFDVRANNYLVKGMNGPERVRKVFLNAVDVAREKKSEYLLLTGVGEHRNVRVEDIRYFDVNQKIVTVHYGEETFEFVSTIGKLENLLFNKGFLRISRSYLVAVRHIVAFSYEKVTLDSGEILGVGRKYYKDLKEAMKNSDHEEN